MAAAPSVQELTRPHRHRPRCGVADRRLGLSHDAAPAAIGT